MNIQYFKKPYSLGKKVFLTVITLIAGCAAMAVFIHEVSAVFTLR